MPLSHWCRLAASLALAALAWPTSPRAADPRASAPALAAATGNLEWMIPDDRLKLPFAEDATIHFVTSTQNAAEWATLKAFWNEVQETAIDPATGKAVQRKAVRIKVPLGLTQPPPVPVENPLTVAKWRLGKKLYFDPILSSNGQVSCASCHDPKMGYTDQLSFSKGIHGKLGGMSAPSVINSAYHTLQFWDGRATSLEDQSQGPVQNALEMFDGSGHAWEHAVTRLRKSPDYVKQFERVFGTPPTRDAVAKAIAAYERTVLGGNSINDRAEIAMRKRVEDEESTKFDVLAKDYEAVLNAAFDGSDRPSLVALELDPAKDRERIGITAKLLAEGRALFFGKARCNSCHVGDNYTDNQFHNLGVGVKDGQIPPGQTGRYERLPAGHKNPDLMGAFKTPTLRNLLHTAPFMHDGGEKTLEAVIDFYDRGGNANEFLDIKMRDLEAELAVRNGNHSGAGVVKFPSGKAIVPLKLNLSGEEKRSLILFLRGLNGDPTDPVIAEPSHMATR